MKTYRIDLKELGPSSTRGCGIAGEVAAFLTWLVVLSALFLAACTEPDATAPAEEHYREFFRLDCTLSDNCGLLPAGLSVDACVASSTASACADSPVPCEQIVTLDGEDWADCRDRLAARSCEQVAFGVVPAVCTTLQGLFTPQ